MHISNKLLANHLYQQTYKIEIFSTSTQPYPTLPYRTKPYPTLTPTLDAGYGNDIKIHYKLKSNIAVKQHRMKY